MTAKDFPITFPYGATSSPYSQANPHRGNDRKMPTGTKVQIGSTALGSSGNTGASNGPHLHTQEWLQTVSNVRKPQNEFKGGTVVNTGIGPTWGLFVTIKCEDGWNISYCHLSKISVKIGDKIDDTEEEMIDKEMAIWLWRTSQKMVYSPTDKQIKSIIGKNVTDVLKDWYNDGDCVENRKIVNVRYPAALKEIEVLKKGYKLVNKDLYERVE